VEVSPDKVLTIRAERKNDREEDGGQSRRVERQYGVFVRRFQVSSVNPV
jgi:HSP20 family molecular chaperone IbpA